MGRGCGVGRGLGVALGVALGVGVTVGVPVGVGLTVAVNALATRSRRWSWARTVQRMNNALPVTAYIGETNAPNSSTDIGARACFVTRCPDRAPRFDRHPR